MYRSVERLSLLSAFLLAFAASVVREIGSFPVTVYGLPLVDVLAKALLVGAIATAAYGVYHLVTDAVVERTTSKRRRHDARNVLRLVFVVVSGIAIFGVLTAQWVGVLFSLGVVGFAVTFALQQPLFSLIGWFYIVVKRPYHVGDRVAIEGSKGDVVDVDFFVTTLWEINGELVSSHQPSGRTITLPNSVVLSSHVHNYSWEEFPYVWNELSVQVAYETDLAFTKAVMEREAEDLLGEEMCSQIRQYRERLDETPVELEVRDGPSVNVRQEESWVDLRLRYLVHPKRGTQVRNELYDRILASLNEHPDRVDFPVSRNR
jgi:small-conductance mechanosensitive channel